MIGLPSVTMTVCSYCTARWPPRVRSVHPSLSSQTPVAPSLKNGSIATTCPLRNLQESVERPKGMNSGASCSARPSLWPASFGDDVADGPQTFESLRGFDGHFELLEKKNRRPHTVGGEPRLHIGSHGHEAPLDTLSTYFATRYLVPLREGGSLPAVVDTEDGMFVVKFRGAGQGARALLAELLVGGLAEAAGLPVPSLALVELDASFGRTEPDPEIQDVLKASRGLNVGLRYLEGALNYDPAAAEDLISAELAARIVWLDAFALNVDRTPRNPNMMIHDGEPWLIDHGAAFYVHHNWARVDEERMTKPFAPIANHVLLPRASSLHDVDEEMAAGIESALDQIVARLPDELLMDAPRGSAPPFDSAEENRQAYRDVLEARLKGRRAFVEAAEAARQEASDE